MFKLATPVVAYFNFIDNHPKVSAALHIVVVGAFLAVVVKSVPDPDAVN